MSEMVERVAIALFGVYGLKHAASNLTLEQSWGMSPQYQDEFRRYARVAIEAMREPTDAQLAALTRSCDTQGQCLVKYGYTAMIDAALSQTIGEK